MTRVRVQSFPPIANPRAITLVLGSMPGAASLAAKQYYAHPHNAFWPIMTTLLKLDKTASYAARVTALKAARIAVWDVFASCLRRGSLDSSIELGSHVVNDFVSFFTGHPRIERVFFNGATAAQCFRREVLSGLNALHFDYRLLPSTSPAHATLRFEDKLAAWRIVVDP
ncbi:MAG: DNA-deoxyinosine glycosylase [Gammaproteobacteria bacterium]|nr:DNA-deoxyinosine glycosylase [Gammaproteobacteria bacterium]